MFNDTRKNKTGFVFREAARLLHEHHRIRELCKDFCLKQFLHKTRPAYMTSQNK